MKARNLGLLQRSNTIVVMGLIGTGIACSGYESDFPTLPGEGASPELATLRQDLQDSQCGSSWDVQDVEEYDGTLGVTQALVSSRQSAVGITVSGMATCSGTLISRDLYLTNRHCLYAVGDQIGFNYQIDASTGLPRASDNYTVVQIVEQGPSVNDYDYAILRLSNGPGDKWGYTPLIRRDEPVGAAVAAIMHPDGVPKVVHASTVTSYPSGVQVIDWNLRFRHQIDVSHGSSGAGTLAADGMLVGVIAEGGCGNSALGNANVSLRMKSLVEYSPRLRALASGNVPLVGDIDGDGKFDDRVVWDQPTRRWSARSFDGFGVPGGLLMPGVQWGELGDIPLIGDFDSDGKVDDVGVWRPSSGRWYALRGLEQTVILHSTQWGTRGDIPLVGDFDSDGQFDDLGVWRPSERKWYTAKADRTIINNGDVTLGALGDVPLVGDFDSDGQIDDFAAWNPSTGNWTAKRKNGTGIFAAPIQWGALGDIPLVGDFDSDGKFDDLGVWRPSLGTWHAKRTDGTVIFNATVWGALGDIPLVGDFDGDGKTDDIGYWRSSSGKWYALQGNGPSIVVDGLQPGAAH